MGAGLHNEGHQLPETIVIAATVAYFIGQRIAQESYSRQVYFYTTAATSSGVASLLPVL